MMPPLSYALPLDHIDYMAKIFVQVGIDYGGRPDYGGGRDYGLRPAFLPIRPALSPNVACAGNAIVPESPFHQVVPFLLHPTI